MAWAGFGDGLEREGVGKRKEKPFSFSVFVNLPQIQTRFEFKATQL
jgi:hypothetical protein